MTTPSSENQVIDPKVFSAFLEGLELRTLRVTSLKVDANKDFSHSDVKNIQHGEEYEFATADGGQLRIDARHKIKLVGPRRKKLGAIDVTISMYYHSAQDVTEEIFQVFGPMARFQVWPHLRELVTDIATRANWPRITIPLLKSP